jgi:hypothetical protein
VDGILDGGFNYAMWGNFIRGRSAVDAPVQLDLEGSYSSPSGMVRVLAEATDFLSFSSLRIFVVVTEDSILFSAPNGTQVHHQTMRDMIPGSTGDPVSLVSPGDTLVREYNFTIGGAWNEDHCNVVVFMQDYSTKEILQVASARISLLGVEEEKEFASEPRILTLAAPRPNPFKDRATIEYVLPSKGHVELRIYDSAGSHVRTLVDGDGDPGIHTEYWDGKDGSGREVSSGVYFSQLLFEGEVRVGRMSLVR